MKLWKGLENEGQHIKLMTLFIGSPDITFDEIVYEIKNDSSILQLYFGAGECTKINEDVLRACVEKYKHLIITAEINLNDLHTYNKELLRIVFVVISITHNNFYLIKEFESNMVQIKIQTLEPKNKQYLSMGAYRYFLETDMKKYKGKVYDTDVVLK